MNRWLLLALALLVLPAGACGQAGLRRPGDCPTLAPAADGSGYPGELVAGLDQLRQLDDEFRLRWPDRRLRERREFREDFVAYAHASLCLAEEVRAITPTGMERYLAFDRHVDDVLSRFIAVLEQGWEAVDSRNRDDYAEFIREVDELRTRLDVLAATASEFR